MVSVRRSLQKSFFRGRRYFVARKMTSLFSAPGIGPSFLQFVIGRNNFLLLCDVEQYKVPVRLSETLITLLASSCLKTRWLFLLPKCQIVWHPHRVCEEDLYQVFHRDLGFEIYLKFSS